MRVKMLLVPLVASVALLAGCTSGTPTPTTTPTPTSNGEEAKSADDILADATAALAAATSVHAKGKVSVSSVVLDLDVTYAGQNVTGTVGYNGITAQLTKVGTDVYVKADTALFATFVPAEQQPLLAMLNGKWAKINAALVGVALPAPLTADKLINPAKPLTKGAATTVDGTAAIAVTDANNVEYDVSTAPGKPYLLKVSNGSNTVTLSDYDKTASITAPAASDVVDILALLSGQS